MAFWPVLSVCLDGGRSALALVAKRSYHVHRGECFPEPTELSLARWSGAAPGGGGGEHRWLTEESDLFAPLKPATDVLVRGSAWSTRGAVRSLNTSVQIGTFRKNVRAWGARTIELGVMGRLRFSDPAPFESMPLTWDNAYGGRDLHAEQKLRPRKKAFARADEGEPGALAYPRNPAGRGFFLDLDRDRLEGAAAPNLEDPEDPVTADRLLAQSPLDWLDRPVGACYEPVDLFAFPRVAFWLGAEHLAPSRPIYEVRKGVLRSPDLEGRAPESAPDARAYNCSAAGFGGVRLSGSERVTLWNLHPRHEILELSLPAEAPTMLLEPPGCGVMEVSPLLQTVLLEPDEDRLTLTWAGTLEVAAPYPEEMCREMRRAVRWSR